LEGQEKDLETTAWYFNFTPGLLSLKANAYAFLFRSIRFGLTRRYFIVTVQFKKRIFPDILIIQNN